MRKNPYLKQEQDFRPLLMRGSFGNNFLTTSEQVQQELNFASETTKETYTLNGISFDMIRPPPLSWDGASFIAKNVQMCSTECTQELFEGVMGFNHSTYDLSGEWDCSKRPVEMVTWFDCIAFCNKLSEQFSYPPYYKISNIKWKRSPYEESIQNAEVTIIGGKGFRLPTRKEWVFFAKAGTNNRWAGTDVEDEVGDYGWYVDNSDDETHPVATRKPNEWGIYDMVGNVC